MHMGVGGDSGARRGRRPWQQRRRLPRSRAKDDACADAHSRAIRRALRRPPPTRLFSLPLLERGVPPARKRAPSRGAAIGRVCCAAFPTAFPPAGAPGGSVRRRERRQRRTSGRHLLVGWVSLLRRGAPRAVRAGHGCQQQRHKKGKHRGNRQGETSQHRREEQVVQAHEAYR